jgi:hypothetical protein
MITRRHPSNLIVELAALLLVGAIVAGLVWLWWWTSPRPIGPADIITGEVTNIVVEPGGKWGNRIRMLVNTEGNTQIALSDRASDFVDCKIGSDIKMSRTKSATGYIGYSFVPGSCSS